MKVFKEYFCYLFNPPPYPPLFCQRIVKIYNWKKNIQMFTRNVNKRNAMFNSPHFSVKKKIHILAVSPKNTVLWPQSQTGEELSMYPAITDLAIIQFFRKSNIDSLAYVERVNCLPESKTDFPSFLSTARNTGL